jgi:hypothetical protein
MSNNKHLFLSIAMAVMILPTLVGASSGDAELTPSAMVSEDRFEFKAVIDGLEVRHAFVIENRGTAPLNIEKVKTG